MNMKARDENLGRLLRSWYGREAGTAEMRAWLPKPRPVSEAIRKIAGGFDQARLSDTQNVASMWADMAGTALARYSRPVRFKEKMLLVEYDRAMILRELHLAKNKMTARIQETFGCDFCSGIWFVPTGG